MRYWCWGYYCCLAWLWLSSSSWLTGPSSLSTTKTMHVLPNSLWVGFVIGNTSVVQDFLPDSLEMAPIKIFRTLPARYYLFFNFFTTEEGLNHLEIITVGRECSTGHKRFVILDSFVDDDDKQRMSLIQTTNVVGAIMMGNFTVMGRKTWEIRMLSSAFSIGCKKYIYNPKISKYPIALEFDPEETHQVRPLRKAIVHHHFPAWTSTMKLSLEPEIAFYYSGSIRFHTRPRTNTETETKIEPDYERDDDMNPLLFMNEFFFL